MTSYLVTLIATASYSVEVEADTEAEAMDKAELVGTPTLCHQCAQIELSDFEANELNVEVLD